MKRILFFVTIFLISFVNAQNPTFEWAGNMGGDHETKAYSVAVDSQGNVYTVGKFRGAVDFNPSASDYYLASYGDIDVFVQKLDADGNFLWAKKLGGSEADFGFYITVDNDGNVYTTGYFSDTANFNPGVGTANLTSNGYNDIFIQKMDTDGNFIWAKSIGGTGGDRGRFISFDGSNNIYVTGYFSDVVDFDPSGAVSNLYSQGGLDAFVLKLDLDGNFIWAKSFGSLSSDKGYSVLTDVSGNVYVEGEFKLTADFDPGNGIFNLTSNGLTDVFILKLNSTGDFQWAKSFGGTSYDRGFDMALDNAGNIYSTGYFKNDVDFDPDTTSDFILLSEGDYDIFVQKLDTNGNFVWAKSFGSTDYDKGYSIDTDILGNVYTTGYFKNTVEFEPSITTSSLTSNGDNDIFILKMDTDGNYNWAVSVGGTTADVPNCITVDDSYKIYTVGYFGDTVDFDPTAGQNLITYHGLRDAFVLKLESDNGSSIKDFEAVSIKLYPNPTSNKLRVVGDDIQTITLSNVYGKTIQQFSSVDSQTTIDLTGYSKGIYFVSIATGKRLITKKIILK